MKQRTRVRVAAMAAAVLLASDAPGRLGAAPEPAPIIDWLFDSTVERRAMARVGDTLLVGGGFLRLAPAAGGVGRVYTIAPATGAVVATGWPAFNGAITAATPDGAGGYYVAGEFTNVGSGGPPRVVHLLPSGQLDPAFQPPASGLPHFVRALVRVGPSLVLGGVRAASATATPAPVLVALDPVTGAFSPWSPTLPPADTDVWDLTTDGTRLFALSGPPYVLGPPRSVTAWDGTSGAQHWVTDVGVPGNFVGGRLALSGGRLLAGVGRLRALDPVTGAIDPVWGAALSGGGGITAIGVAGPVIYVAGQFDTFGGQPRAQLAAVDAATGALLPWSPQAAGGLVEAMAVSPSGTVFVGMGASVAGAVNGVARFGVYEIDPAGTVTAFESAAGADAVSLLQTTPTGALLVSGEPAYVGRATRSGLAMFDLATGSLLPPSIAVGASFSARPYVSALLAYQGTVYIQGGFDTVNGQLRPGLAAVDVATGTVLPWPANGVLVSQLEVVDGAWLYAFVNLPALRRIHAVTGVIDPSWNPPAGLLPGNTRGPFLVGDELMTAGLASPLNCGTGLVLSTLDKVTGAWREWLRTSDVNGALGVASDGDTVYVAGGSRPPGTCGDTGFVLAGYDRQTGRRVAAPTISGLPGPGLFGEPVPHASVGIADGRLFVAGAQVLTSPAPTAGLVELARPNRLSGFTAPVTTARVFGDVLAGIEVVPPIAANDFHVRAYRLTGASAPSNLRQQGTGPVTTFTWDGMATPPSGGYAIEGGVAPGQTLAALPVGGATSVALPLGAGPLYVRVRSQDTGEVSNEIVAGCLAAPLPPTGLTATLNGAALTLTWTPPASAVAGYTLQAGATSGTTAVTVPLAAAPPTLSGPVPPGTYYVRMTASNACGTSGPSGETWFTVGAAEALPGLPTNLAATVNGGLTTFSWTPPAGSVTGHQIEAGSLPGLANLATVQIGAAGQLVVPGIPPGTYYIRVRAVNTAGTGAPSADVVVVVQ